MKCSTVSSPLIIAGPKTSVRTLEDILSIGHPEEVQGALAELAKQNTHLDLSTIRLTPKGLEAVCSVVGNPLSSIRFERVTWGWVPDFQPVLECLPYTLAGVFDISRMHSEFNGASYFGGVAKFRDFNALLMVHRKGPFKATVVVDSEGNEYYRAELEQLQKQGIDVSDAWRQMLLRKINSEGPGCLPSGWHKNVDIDLHFNPGEDVQVLSSYGLHLLVDSMNVGIHSMPISGVGSNFRKSSLVLGRVSALAEFFKIDPSRVPKRLDLSHVRICASETDEGTRLTDRHAEKLINLIESHRRGHELSLEVLCIDVSDMSKQVVSSLQNACDTAKVKLETIVQPMSRDHSQALPVTVDHKLSAEFANARENDAVWWIAEQLEDLPDPVTRLSPDVRKQLEAYAYALTQAGNNGVVQGYGRQILQKLRPDVPAVTSKPVNSSPATAIDHSLSSEFEAACIQGDSAFWIAQQLVKAPEIVQKLDPNVVQQLRTYAEGLVAGYGSLYQELGATILRQLTPR